MLMLLEVSETNKLNLAPSIFFLYPVKSYDIEVFCFIFVFCSPGLDDLRDWTNNVQPHIPIYTAMRDFEVYLFSQHTLKDIPLISNVVKDSLPCHVHLSGDEEDSLLLG